MQDKLFVAISARAGLVKAWLCLAISSLALAGALSILVALFRAPGISKIMLALLPFKDFFHTALVVHVDLSVVVWLLSCCCLLFTVIIREQFLYLSKAALGLAVIGTVLLVFSPFAGDAGPLMNNYIPVLQSLTFFLGIAFFFVAVLLQIALALMSYKPGSQIYLYHAIYVTALIILIASLCFLLSQVSLSRSLKVLPENMQEFYEMLFWGGGMCCSSPTPKSCRSLGLCS